MLSIPLDCVYDLSLMLLDHLRVHTKNFTFYHGFIHGGEGDKLFINAECLALTIFVCQWYMVCIFTISSQVLEILNLCDFKFFKFSTRACLDAGNWYFRVNVLGNKNFLNSFCNLSFGITRQMFKALFSCKLFHLKK